jgi:hypothetical protein
MVQMSKDLDKMNPKLLNLLQKDKLDKAINKEL